MTIEAGQTRSSAFKKYINFIEPFAARRPAVANRKTGCGNVLERSHRDPHPLIVL